MERHLARQIVSKFDLRYLGITGLGATQDIIDTALKDSKGDVTKAARLVIKVWSSEYTDKEQAYIDLCELLKKIHRTSWIKEPVEDELD